MKILLDFDSTICNTGKAMFDYYRELTNDYSTEYSEDKVTWNMSNLIKFNQQETDNMFIQEGFFKHLELYPNAYEILNKLKQDGHYLHIVTCHNLLGAEYKLRWIKNNLPMIDEVTIIPIEHGLVKFDKSSVDGMVLIDDSISALQTSKAKYKYLYGSFRWNNSCNEFKRIASWLDFYEEIKSIEKKEGN